VSNKLRLFTFSRGDTLILDNEKSGLGLSEYRLSGETLVSLTKIKTIKRRNIMPSRHELNMRAVAMNFDPSTIANDSKLEQKVLWLEKNQAQAAISGTAPTTTLTSSGVAQNNETMTIGNVTYTFKTALSSPAVANEILIGAAATNTLDNIKDAINGTSVSGSPGTIYSQPTKRHPQVTAGAKTATTLVIAPADVNTGGSMATTETLANFAFTGATMSAGTLGNAGAMSNATVKDTLSGLAGDANTSL
jgi:hypothetical protein